MNEIFLTTHGRVMLMGILFGRKLRSFRMIVISLKSAADVHVCVRRNLNAERASLGRRLIEIIVAMIVYPCRALFIARLVSRLERPFSANNTIRMREYKSETAVRLLYGDGTLAITDAARSSTQANGLITTRVLSPHRQ